MPDSRCISRCLHQRNQIRCRNGADDFTAVHGLSEEWRFLKETVMPCRNEVQCPTDFTLPFEDATGAVPK